MKEEEAKTKWCPHAKSVPDASGWASGNVFEGVESNSPLDNKCKCIGSNCMMWIESDKEGEPSNNARDDFIYYYPAGDCGLKNRSFP